jgi:HemX protein
MLALFTDRQWLWGAAGFYLAGWLLGTVSLVKRGQPSGIAVFVLLALGFVFQNFGLAVRGQAVGGCPLGNTFELYQFTAWSAIAVYLAVGVTFRSSLLGYLTAGLATAITLVSLAQPAWDSARRVHIFGGNPWIELHAALALFSYGVFGLLTLTSLLCLLRLHSLQSKHLGGRFALLPSLHDLDQIGVRLLLVGVILLAASLGVGAVYWLRDTDSVSAAKLLATVAVFAAAVLILGLRLRGWLVTQRFAWACVALFAAALLSLTLVDSSRRPLTPVAPPAAASP